MFMGSGLSQSFRSAPGALESALSAQESPGGAETCLCSPQRESKDISPETKTSALKLPQKVAGRLAGAKAKEQECPGAALEPRRTRTKGSARKNMDGRALDASGSG